VAKVRVPLAVALNVDEHSAGAVTRFSSFVHNGVIADNDAEPDKKTFVTQRPSVYQFMDPADSSVNNTKGRGLYYKGSSNIRYIVNSTEVYSPNYDTSLGTIGGGTKKVYMQELDVYVTLVDSENNQGWTITGTSAPAEITDVDFPPKATASLTLCGGNVSLNGYMFVGTTNGRIYNSDNGDPTAWRSTGFVTAERNVDGGIHILKHFDHIAFLGAYSLEFFQDAAIASPASPLQRRSDLYYSIGCASSESVWTSGDRTMFVGTDGSGSMAVYRLENFKLSKISPYGMDAFLTDTLIDSDLYSAVASGFSAYGRMFYILTVHTTPDDISSKQSFVYDVTRNVWMTWGTENMTVLDANGEFPIVDWALYTGTSPRIGEGLMANGSLFTVSTDLTPTDTTGELVYILDSDSYIATDYFADTAGTDTNIEFKIRTGHQDGGTSNRKYVSELRVIGDFTDTDSNNATIRWSDGDHSTYSTYSRSINLGRQANIKMNGSFDRRSWELLYSNADIIRAEAVELFVREGRS